MKTKLLLSALILLSPFSFLLSPCTAQVPLGFNYQAIARDGSGAILPNTALPVKIAIQTSSGTVIYEELFSSVITNQFGLISLVVGTGVWQSGSALNFSAIDWKSQPLYLKTTIRYPGLTWTVMGTSQIWSVPYSLLAKDVQSPLSKLGITGTTDNMEEALFEVKNKTGNTVFAVYNEGVRAYVGNGDAKGVKGGFAVGGYDGTKSTHDLMYVTSDSVRIYVDSNPATKGVRGGFSVGGYDMAKGTLSKYLNIETESVITIDPAENRILWYPIKNAFMTGRILIQKNDTVGENSFASGYESKAIGDWSQALGYKSLSRGNYSTAIGKFSQTKHDNSFAFGNQAKAVAADSYAFGTGAKASGQWSFALGSVGVDSLGHATGPTIASGIGAFALGFGSVSSAQGAFSFGVQDTASGLFSLAMGYLARAKGHFSTTMGLWTTAESASLMGLAAGFGTKAGSWASSAFGDRTYASGHTSFSTGFMTTASGHTSSTFGELTIAPSYCSMALGQYNAYSGTANSWVTTDPVFMIGIGTSIFDRRNGMTVYKNGNMDLAGSLNNTLIAPNGQVEINGGGTGIRASYVDFHADDYWSDFAFRILRNNGVNGATDIIHRGTGNLNLTTYENSSIVFSTWNAESMRIKGSNGFIGINTANPVYMVDVGGSMNLNKGLSGLGALYVNGSEAIWFNGTYYSWGYGSTYNAFNSKTIIGSTGNPGSYMLWVNGNAWSSGSWAGSDVRWKKDISDLGSMIDKVSLLQGVTYKWRKDEFPGMNFDDGTQIGLVAQDVEKVFPDLVRTDDKGYKAVAYDKLSVILLQGIKDQQKQIKSQQEQIDRLQNIVNEMNVKLDELINK
jgi:hypothetical protein